MSLTSFGGGYSNTPFTFSFFILISSGPITTPRNPTSLTFYLHFSSFIYKLFSINLFITSSTILLCSFSFFVPTIMLFMKLATSLMLIKSQRILFIIVWNVTREFLSPKNITVGSNDSSGVMNIAFHLSSSFICILL